MNYAPEKLETLTFCRTILNGYNKSQVDHALSKIIEDYNQNIDEINELKDHICALNEKVKRYQSIEEAMQNCFVLAQHTSDEMKMSAAEKAKNIIKEAEATSQQMVNDANVEVNKIKFAYEDTKNKIYSFKLKSQALLQAQLDVLKQMSEQ